MKTPKEFGVSSWIWPILHMVLRALTHESSPGGGHAWACAIVVALCLLPAGVSIPRMDVNLASIVLSNPYCTLFEKDFFTIVVGMHVSICFRQQYMIQLINPARSNQHGRFFKWFFLPCVKCLTNETRRLSGQVLHYPVYSPGNRTFPDVRD